MGSKVYIWKNECDEARLGHPSNLRPQGYVNRANTLKREDRQITVSEVADMLDVSPGSAYVTGVSISLCLWLVQELATDLYLH
jgi:hypothetical protein